MAKAKYLSLLNKSFTHRHTYIYINMYTFSVLILVKKSNLFIISAQSADIPVT